MPPRPISPHRRPNDSLTIHLSPDHRELLLGMAVSHGVPVSSLLTALWSLVAAAPPEEPLPPQELRRRNVLPRGVRFQPCTARPTEVMASALVLLVPSVFLNASRLTGWALDHRADLVTDYYASPTEAEALRKDVLAAARAHIVQPQPEPAPFLEPVPADPRLGKPVEGPCPACPPDAPSSECALCEGAGKITRTMREWCALRGLKLKSRRAA